MKNSLLTAICTALLVVPGCSDDNPVRTKTTQSQWVLPADSASFAVLVFDYESETFDGGALSHFTPCSGCDENEVPLDYTYRPPGDFGSIAFTYTATGDTIFYATIIWLGEGAIIKPGEFHDADDFITYLVPTVAPQVREGYNPQGIGTPGGVDLELIVDHVRKLDITREFAKTSYVMGTYVYGPAVGLFDPGKASIVVFLYRSP